MIKTVIRAHGTNRRGDSFTQSEIEAVWRKGTVIPNEDPALLRKDACGVILQRDHHGKATSRGWEIDHKFPVAFGGGDEIENLQPLYWETNRDKGDRHPWFCA